MLVSGQYVLHPDMEEEILKLADDGAHEEPMVSIDAWMEWLLKEYEESRSATY